jgi:hypothetical protein
MDRVHAWVLMDNHYHLFIETPEAKSGGGNDMVTEHLYETLQREAAGGEKVFGDPLQVRGGWRGIA